MVMPEELIRSAENAMHGSYAPYSNFKVGAALLCENGTIFTGCNIENASYPAGICAERVALSKAISEGHQRFLSIAIVGGEDGEIGDYCYPCGICRQVLAEFVDADFKFYFKNAEERIISYAMEELLPHSFSF
ncbi:MAG: cytidine deaminase [Ruminococcaceae bacterium]|nr:cytidine deaminase [Oscillospiraceae bacterium]